MKPELYSQENFPKNLTDSTLMSVILEILLLTPHPLPKAENGHRELPLLAQRHKSLLLRIFYSPFPPPSHRLVIKTYIWMWIISHLAEVNKSKTYVVTF